MYPFLQIQIITYEFFLPVGFATTLNELKAQDAHTKVANWLITVIK